MTLFDYDTKVSKREQLQTDMNADGFWDNADAAQKVIAAFKLIKAQIDPLEETIEVFEEAKVGLELAKEANDRELLEEADEQLFQVVQRMEKVELQSLLSGPHDHRNCFVAIQAVRLMYTRLGRGEAVSLPALHHDTSVLDVEEDRIIWIREADLGKHAPA